MITADIRNTALPVQRRAGYDKRTHELLHWVLSMTVQVGPSSKPRRVRRTVG